MRTRRQHLAALLFTAASLSLLAWAAYNEPGLRPVLALWALMLFGHALWVWSSPAPTDELDARLKARLEVELALRQGQAQALSPITTRSRVPKS
jgi:hypothetical protein